jgi:hypothetical protein
MKKKMVQCSTVVNKNAVRREVINGVEHIIVSSYTLPDNVVMNGGLYPEDEIQASYKTLERTLAPIEHPHDADGNFLSASDPDAIHNFYAGAYNVNVKRENGRVHIDKQINVQEAMKTDRGKRLLDRIKELEENEKPRPIHTSVGLFLEVEELEGPQTNAEGQEYQWIARNMVFDHDAILLDSVGAAQPSQGVGMAVNAEGEQIEVESVYFEHNASGKSHRKIEEDLENQFKGIVAYEWCYLVDVFEDAAVFETNDGLFEIAYTMHDEKPVIAGIPARVDRVVKYEPKVNTKRETKGDSMFKEMVVNALAKAGIPAEGLSDEELIAKYNELQEEKHNGDGKKEESGDLAEVVANALKPISEELKELKAEIAANADSKKAELVELVVNSGKYPGLDAEGAKALPEATLKEMAANCESAEGLPLAVNFDDSKLFDFDMPE